MIRNLSLPSLLAFCIGLTSMHCAIAAGPLAIQNAKIIPIASETIERGSILIEDGQIVAFGADIEIPGEAKVIDAEGKVIMPGFIDAHNAAAMSQANEQNSLVPFLSVVDSIDPIASYFEECRRNGITTAAVVPGNSTLIGGKAAIVKTAGSYVDDMIVKRDFALKLSLRPTSGSRMSQMARLRKELDKAKKALAKEKEEAKKEADSEKATANDKEAEKKSDEDSAKPATPSAADEGLEALKQAVQGKLPVYIYCAEAMDVPAAKQLIKDYNLNAIFVLGQSCYKAASMFSGSDDSVILDPTLVYWETNPRTREDKKIILPEIYGNAKVPYVFQISDSSSRRTLGSSYFWYQAATAVKYGLSQEKALAALTLEPAKLIGIDDLVGSIEVGKNADLVILTGEPLDIGTWVEHTIVDGEIVYDRSEDEKLERLLAPVAE